MADGRTPIDPDTPIPDVRPEPKDRVEVGDIPGLDPHAPVTDEDGKAIHPQDAPRRGDDQLDSVTGTEDERQPDRII